MSASLPRRSGAGWRATASRTSHFRQAVREVESVAKFAPWPPSFARARTTRSTWNGGSSAQALLARERARRRARWNQPGVAAAGGHYLRLAQMQGGFWLMQVADM